MPRVRDPQGHEFTASLRQLEAGIPCRECGWICSLQEVLPDDEEPPQEPIHEPPDPDVESAADVPEDDEDEEA